MTSVISTRGVTNSVIIDRLRTEMAHNIQIVLSEFRRMPPKVWRPSADVDRLIARLREVNDPLRARITMLARTA